MSTQGGVVTVTVESTTPSAVIDRVSLVLDAFDGPGRLTLAQIVRRTGLPRSSAHRMLERLVQLRWLRRSGRDYELGMRLVELGSLAVHQDRLHRAAIPLLHDLHRATGLVVHLAVLDGADVVYLEKIGDRMTAAIPTRVGGRQPAHCAAVGKAMLAYTELPDVVDLASRKTKYSIRTPAQLSAELAKVHAHGVAFDREESLRGFGLCRSANRGSGRSSRRRVGVRPDESDDVRPAPGRTSAHDRDGHLAQRRGRPAARCAHAATNSSSARRAALSPGMSTRRRPRVRIAARPSSMGRTASSRPKRGPERAGVAA
jgi:DNA-binding IclR family transcriptional regulator